MMTMYDELERLLAALSPAIDIKCAQLRQARRERIRTRIFVLLCALAIVIPTAFAFFGVSLTVLVIPAAFMSAAVLALSPILLKQQGGHTCEQIQ